MLEVKGIYNTAKVFADIVDETTINQIEVLLTQSFTEGLRIRIMPDCHAGKGCVIGTTMTIQDKLVPNLVGVDIGCGMLTVELPVNQIDLEKLDNFIQNHIPSGMNVYKEKQKVETMIDQLRCWNEFSNKTYHYRAVGTLGGGNHFIEIDQDQEGKLYLIIHSGSRNLGKCVAEYYQDQAVQYHKDKLFNKKEAIDLVIKEYKETHREAEIQNKIQEIKNMFVELDMPEELCYLEGKLFSDYLFDMDLTQQYATENRKRMATKIVEFLGFKLEELVYFETIHNYINMKDMILRKGAISAYAGERVLIPINMRDGCIIGTGKSCEEYNNSAPHGAGRILSRKKAMKEISLEDFKSTMKGIYSTTVCEETLDESPFAYKPLEAILDNIKETVEIEKIIKPIYNFKSTK